MRVHGTLVFATLIFPTLLLAQAPSGDKPAQSNAGSSKPAYAQPNDGSAPAASGQAAANSAATQNHGAEKAKPQAPVPYPVMSKAAKERARQLCNDFIRGQLGPVYAAFSPSMKKSSPQGRLTMVSKQMGVKLGSPGQVISESFLPGLAQPITVYSQVTAYSKSKLPIVMFLSVNEQGELDSLQIAPVPDPPKDSYANYQDKVKLRLPFDGTWMVSQGGRKLFENAFAGSDDDRYAVAFIYLKDGRPFDNAGTKNEDFYCWGQPVLAPAGGTVVQSVNSVPDHAPGTGSEVESRGNFVVLAHGNSEFSVLPYLKSGSVKVRTGQRVKQGDVVGECGNSGSSYAPHLEYRLQNTRGFPLPKTLPIQFVDYLADGKEVASGEPVRGQSISNGSKAPDVETAAKPQ